MVADGDMLLRLLISCPDRPGIVAAVSRFLYEAGANLVTSDQYSTDPESGSFFLRMAFAIAADRYNGLTERFGLSVAEPFDMKWRLWNAREPKRVAIMVSRYDHCLLELLWRWRRGELGAEVVLVGSNHPDLREEVESFGLPYHHIPVTPESKAEAEAQLLEVLRGRCDLVVLARYMQVFSGQFLERVGVPMINIHHSFLPAFPGREPYEKAKDRGVKLIGATAHYVTEDLDAGPIIERTVLARAVMWHCEDRVLRHRNTTIVF